jgi:low affinity Fe/Cu permease
MLATIIFLFLENKKIRDVHALNIKKLQEIIHSLHHKQKTLNEKVIISNEYSSNYTKDMKSLGDEVVKLQKVFIDIISNRNYK